MEINFHPGFKEMDKWSLKGQPFFFMVNFLMDKVKVLTGGELSDSGLRFDFQDVKNNVGEQANISDFYFHSFPEGLEDYREGFENVQSHIRLGNSYLANYTRKTPIETSLSLKEIFLRSKSKYKVFYNEEFVFFSPETFVEIKDNKIFTHPMKGTIDASLENAEALLKNSVKERAEHYTVVDLLRNDLSMVADEVTVEEFQRIDLIRTQGKDLLAMSSEISGKLKPEFQNKIGSIMHKLLPAGSILGAPKEKTKQIVLESESYERGWYTGVCGWFDGKNLDSCVMIRFIEEENGQKYFKSGGGITNMSCLEDEYQEMKNKIYVPFY